jgi:DNA-directed RNA polymerase specialized sigma24 family protein
MASRVNAAWGFKAIASRIVDFYRRSQRDRRIRQRAARRNTSRRQETDPELVLLVRSKVTLLPSRLRAFYILRFRLGLNQGEVAQRLGASRAAVRHLEQQCVNLLTRVRE